MLLLFAGAQLITLAKLRLLVPSRAGKNPVLSWLANAAWTLAVALNLASVLQRAHFLTQQRALVHARGHPPDGPTCEGAVGASGAVSGASGPGGVSADSGLCGPSGPSGVSGSRWAGKFSAGAVVQVGPGRPPDRLLPGEVRRLGAVAVKFACDLAQGLPGVVGVDLPDIVDYSLGLCSGLVGTALCFMPEQWDEPWQEEEGEPGEGTHLKPQQRGDGVPTCS